jgi:hypothetical protein
MYKFKDLYVAVTPETSDAGQQENLLYFDANPAQPSVETQTCPATPGPPRGTTACCDGGGFSIVALFPSPESVELKKYLAGQLATQKVKKEAIQESHDLVTVAEIEALEHKLNGALSELKNRKASLQKTVGVTK